MDPTDRHLCRHHCAQQSSRCLIYCACDWYLHVSTNRDRHWWTDRDGHRDRPGEHSSVLTAVAAQTVTLGNALTFVVGAMDVDGDAPIFVSVSLPSGASLSATGAFSWPAATPAGTYTLTYFARDNDANSPQGMVNISVVQATPGPPASPGAPADSPSVGGSGGGCTLSQTGSVDMLLPALVLLSLVLWASRLKKMRFSLGIDQPGKK